MQPATIDKSNERVRAMFAQIAGKYDRMNHLLSGNVDRYWRRQTVRRVFPVGSAPILDVCTGTGDLAFAYCKATGGRVPIVAADFCQEMLEVANKKKAQRGIDDRAIQFVQADTQQLPFPDDQFQIVSVAFGLRNVADTDQGLREMARVAQPGGRVAVLEFSSPQLPLIRTAYGGFFRHVLPRLGQWLAPNDHQAYGYLPASVGEFPAGQALVERMQTAGLRHVTYRPLTLGIATLYVGTK